jgi:hypothetical protein
MRTPRGWLLVVMAVGSAIAAASVQAQTRGARFSLDDAGMEAPVTTYGIDPRYVSPGAAAAALPPGWASVSPFQVAPVAYGRPGTAAVDAAGAWAGGPPMVMPAQHAESMYGGPVGNEGCYGPEFYDYGAYSDGVVAGWIRGLLPYTEGGRCAPRWYDIALDGMFLKREEIGDNVGFTANARFAGPPNVPSIVLSTNDLDYDEEIGFRFNAAVIAGPGSSIEFTYFGLFDWTSTASVTDPTNNLFSIYTNYGFPTLRDEVDQAQFHSINATSTLDNFELNIRRRWTGPNCRLQGSYLAGVRYVYLLDELAYHTIGRNDPGTGQPIGRSDTQVDVQNSLTGFQAGGDLWATILPGVSVGGDLKAGVYGNYAKYNTSVFASTTPPAAPPAPVLEEAKNNDIAVVAEANAMVVYRVGPNLTLRGGYSFLYLENVALAMDNFNPTNPFVAPRAVRPVVNNGNVFYHGGFAGLEWMW